MGDTNHSHLIRGMIYGLFCGQSWHTPWHFLVCPIMIHMIDGKKNAPANFCLKLFAFSFRASELPLFDLIRFSPYRWLFCALDENLKVIVLQV